MEAATVRRSAVSISTLYLLKLYSVPFNRTTPGLISKSPWSLSKLGETWKTTVSWECNSISNTVKSKIRVTIWFFVSIRNWLSDPNLKRRIQG